MREIFQRIVQTSGAQVYSLLVAFVTLTLTARWLGPGGRGTIAAITMPTEKEHLAAITACTDHEPEGVQASPRSARGALGCSCSACACCALMSDSICASFKRASDSSEICC